MIAEARKLGLDGWVRKRANGNVEALVSGDDGAVQALIGACMRGPDGSRVTSVDLEKAEAPEEKGFHRRSSI